MTTSAPDVEVMEPNTVVESRIPSICTHPAERLVRQKRIIKGSATCCGCCSTSLMRHKCMRCGKIAEPPHVIKPGSSQYEIIKKALADKKRGAILTHTQRLAIERVVVGSAGCVLVYRSGWHKDNISKYEPITGLGGGSACAAGCGGGVG